MNGEPSLQDVVQTVRQFQEQLVTMASVLIQLQQERVQQAANHEPSPVIQTPLQPQDHYQVKIINNVLKSGAIAPFKGERSATHCTSFLSQCREAFDLLKLGDEGLQVRVAAMLLRDRARYWWDNREGKPSTWLTFEESLLREFYPYEEAEAVRDKMMLLNLKQCKSLAAYNETFRDLALLANNMSEEDKIAYYIRGLPKSMKLQVRRNQPATLQQATAAAIRDDVDYQVSYGSNNNNNHPIPATTFRPAPTRIDPSPMELGTIKFPPRLTDEERARCIRERLCFACRQPGHTANGGSCPLKQVSNKPADSSAYPYNYRHVLLHLRGQVGSQGAKILVDSGATHDFVSRRFIEQLTPHQQKLMGPPENVSFVDGTKRTCFGETVLNVYCNGYSERRRFRVIDMTGPDAILGKPWLTDRNPAIEWRMNTIHLFYQGQKFTLSERETSPATPNRHTTSTSVVSYKKIRRIAKKSKQPLYLAFINSIPEGCNLNHVISEGDRETEQIDHRLQELINANQELFEPPSGPPPDRPVKHTIPLEPNAKIPAQKLYRLSFAETAELKTQLADLLKKKWIRPSTSPFGAPVLFVPKANNRGLRLCVDYRGLNDITTKDRYGMPRIDDLLDQLSRAKVMSKLDLHCGFHQVGVDELDIHKTAFRTKFGHYEFMVMPFGLTSAPATFQRLMNQILQPLLFEGVLVYLDDILIYSETMEEHLELLEKVFSLLKKNQLHVARDKCEFARTSISFLGHTIDQEGIHPDPHKIDLIKNWPTPKNQSELRSFLGLANYYRKFVLGFSKLAHPLTRLTGKQVPWTWSKDEQNAFNQLRTKLTSAPVLKCPDPEKPFYIFFDASSTVAVGAVLSQLDEQQNLHPVAFESRKLTSAEANYPVHEIECAAFVHALRSWRHYLDAARFYVFTDNSSLRSIHTNENLSSRQIRWMAEIQQYQFTIEHIPREKNTVADALSKYPQQRTPVPRSTNSFNMEADINPSIALINNNPSFPAAKTEFLDAILTGYGNDPRCARILTNTYPPYQLHNGLIYYCNSDEPPRLLIPNQKQLIQRILKDEHDNAGHFGLDKTYELTRRKYCWTRQYRSVQQYIKKCDSCQRMKHSNEPPSGLLTPTETPILRWDSLVTDWAVGLPRSTGGHDSCQIVMDRLTRFIVLIPQKSTFSSLDIFRSLERHVFAARGYPSHILGDRDPRLSSKAWADITGRFGIRTTLSTSGHHETVGLAERSVRTIKEVLRHYVNYRQNNWEELLPSIQLAINDTLHPSTGFTPFFADAGRHPRLAKLVESPSVVPAVDALVDRLSTLSGAIRDHLQSAQEQQKFYHDQYRRAARFEIGDQVLLDASAVPRWQAHVNRQSQKLLPTRFGPFSVTAKDQKDNYTLELPALLKIHPVFHVSRLSPYHAPNHPVTPPTPDLIDGYLEYEVDSILDKRIYRRQTQYLVKWKNLPLDEATWEPTHHLTNAQDLITDFENGTSQ